MSLECVPSNPSPHLAQSEPDDMTETDAIRLAQEGDAGAFERIFRLYKRRFWSSGLRMGRNQSEAEDLTQGSFVPLLRQIPSRQWERTFSTWLHRVSVNV